MCVKPGLLRNGQLIGCRKCWQCKERRINDWVGRNIAESKTAIACNFVTLTYGRDLRLGTVDHERAAVLTYSDVQKFFKSVRKAGYKLRYFCVGEYGTLKGRSHWHVLIYWTTKNIPKFTLDVREDSPFWKHGFVQWEKLTPQSIRYACKYIQKDIGEMERQGHLAMSKKPPLGDEYFRRRAQQYVDQYLAPQDLGYGWPEVMDRNGKKLSFMLGGKPAENFISAYLELWRAQHGKAHSPWSQLVEDYQDKFLEDETKTIDEWDDVERSRLAENDRVKKLKPPLVAPPGDGVLLFSPAHNSYYVEFEGQKLFWSFDDDGNRAWIGTIRSESESEKSVERLLDRELSGRPKPRRLREKRRDD